MKTLLQKTIDIVKKYTFPKNSRWARKTLVVGPSEPVDGDSLSSTKALLNHLRAKGLEAYTLPTLSMFQKYSWIIKPEDIHPANRDALKPMLTTDNLQSCYDALINVWIPDEIVIVDGRRERIGFDPLGVQVFEIDHHTEDGAIENQDSLVKQTSSTGCVLIDYFKIYEPILAISILTDTFWFRQNQPTEAVRYLSVLTKHGLTDELLEQYQRQLFVPKNPRVLLAMQEADLRFGLNGDLAFLVLKTSDPEIHLEVKGQLGYYAKHVCAVRADGYVSFKSTDENVDLRPLAIKYGRGGHPSQAAGQIDTHSVFAIDKLYNDFKCAISKAKSRRLAFC